MTINNNMSEVKDVPESENKMSDQSVIVDVTKPKVHIGLFGAVTFGMGSMIGSGIFISPTGALQNAGSIGTLVSFFSQIN